MGKICHHNKETVQKEGSDEPIPDEDVEARRVEEQVESVTGNVTTDVAYESLEEARTSWE